MEEVNVGLIWETGNNYTANTSHAQLKVGEDYHRPMELLLVSLGGCMGVDIANILRKKRQNIEGININVIGNRRDDFPRIYDTIKLICEVKGKDVDKKAVESAVDLSIKKYCSVYAMLSKSSQIQVEIKVWEEKE